MAISSSVGHLWDAISHLSQPSIQDLVLRCKGLTLLGFRYHSLKYSKGGKTRVSSHQHGGHFPIYLAPSSRPRVAPPRTTPSRKPVLLPIIDLLLIGEGEPPDLRAEFCCAHRPFLSLQQAQPTHSASLRLPPGSLRALESRSGHGSCSSKTKKTAGSD